MTPASARHETLRCLLALVEYEQHGSCYGSARAEALLRSQSSPEELVALGASEALIGLLWPSAMERETAPEADENDE